MLSNEPVKAVDGNGNGNGHKPTALAKTIDLQGVASFASLVELLAQELGTTAGRIQGLLPSGPATFEELVGEINLNNQGYQRSLTLMTKPGYPLKLRFVCSWRQGSDPEAQPVSGVESHFFLDAKVEQIIPQGRALARYIEDTFAVMDRMVTIGHAGRLSNMSVSDAEVAAFENSGEAKLVESAFPKRSSSFQP
jgi:hypothetical protein